MKTNKIRNVFVLTTILLAIAGGFSAIAAESKISFVALKPGDEIRIEFESTGCFHSYKEEIKVFRTNEFRALLVTLRPIEKTATKRVQEIPPKEMVLSDSDVRKLDATLAYYRGLKGGLCTTTDKVKITQFHEGKISSTETYVDRTCGLIDRRLAGSLKEISFVDLIARLNSFR